MKLLAARRGLDSRQPDIALDKSQANHMARRQHNEHHRLQQIPTESPEVAATNHTTNGPSTTNHAANGHISNSSIAANQQALQIISRDWSSVSTIDLLPILAMVVLHTYISGEYLSCVSKNSTFWSKASLHLITASRQPQGFPEPTKARRLVCRRVSSGVWLNEPTPTMLGRLASAMGS